MKHQVVEHRLGSGAQGLVVQVPGSAVVNVRITFHSGFQFSDRKAYEVPHVMEHLLATVTRRHNQPNAFMIDAQKNGAYVNASTSADTNEYIYECAAFELSRILDLVEEQLCEPWFDTAPFRAEVSNVREELTRNTTQHMSVCTMALYERAFPKLWLNFEDRIKQLDHLELAQLERHYHRTHTAANARFYIAGDFEDQGAGIVARLEQMFRRLPKGERLMLSREMGLGMDEPMVIKKDIAQIYYRSSLYFEEIARELRPVLTILRVILGGGMGSRVLGEARRRGLAYSLAVTGYAELGGSSLGFAGYVTPKHAVDLFEVMQRHLEALAQGEGTETELTAAKDYLIGSITRSTQTASDLLHWYLERYDDESEIQDFSKAMSELEQVRLRDVTNMAGRIRSTSRNGLSLLGPLRDSQAQKLAATLFPK